MSLTVFYKNTVHLNDTRTGGWAPFYYGIFAKIIKDNNYKIVAEVGIGYGTHAKSLLRETDVEQLYLVDPMVYYPNDGFSNDIQTKKCDVEGAVTPFEGLVSLIKAELDPWKDRYTWFRTKSLDVTPEQIPDELLDAVFIDGDHTYQAVLDDLAFWWKKVKVGGHVVGDDYWIDDVKRAVDAFGKPYDLLTLPDNTYKIYCLRRT